jgi:PII-like signaling protein
METAHLVETSGRTPLTISCIDADEHVNRVPARVKEMAAHLRIVREKLVLEQGNLD